MKKQDREYKIFMEGVEAGKEIILDALRDFTSNMQSTNKINTENK